MPNIKLIARETLRQLIENKIEPTPEAYEKEYYRQMKKMGIKTKEEEPIDLNRLLGMLQGDAKEIGNKTFKNKDELTIFLIKVLNLIYHYRKNFNTLLETEKIFLRLLSTHPNKEINTLAKGELIEIDKISFQAKENYKKRWIEQSQKHLEVKWNDFDKTLEFISDLKIANDKFKSLQKEVKKYLKGSRDREIGKNLLKKIETFFQELSLSPTLPEEDLKPEQTLNAEKTSVLKYTDMDSLPINSATTLISKEGMQDVLNFAEREYKENKRNYAVVVFGIVGYDQAIEAHGKEALKRVLAILGKFLKQYSNASDLIAYYGEEEFLACLLERQKDQAIAFIRQLDTEVKKSTFIYQQTRIHIKLSAQVSHRIDEESLEKMLKVTLEEFVKHKDTQGVIDYED
ncbi:diguanylate cyclase domain-containing protein [Helicobacter mesocricetorum]|uniref:diguanylate cyclase domain-containing protein n=1 Tax=Helicobacter mesocricetorum TaxID=87012 RepID=UPI000CF14EC9|nr:diguanylate cyclase [Helicobacter mesocricetorum]